MRRATFQVEVVAADGMSCGVFAVLAGSQADADEFMAEQVKEDLRLGRTFSPTPARALKLGNFTVGPIRTDGALVAEHAMVAEISRSVRALVRVVDLVARHAAKPVGAGI